MIGFLIYLCLSEPFTEYVNATCYVSNGIAHVETGKLDKEGGAAWAIWEDTIHIKGFNHITIETNANVPSEDQMLCAGYVDGFLMQHRIYERFNLYKDIMKMDRKSQFPDNWTTWLRQNIEYTNKTSRDNQKDKYWRSISLILKQFEGLVNGYQKAAEKNETEKLTDMDLWIIQSIGDIYDLEELWNPSAEINEIKYMECSALVSLAPNFSDIYFGHNSWSDYRKMTNLIKEYHFNIKEFVARRVVVSTKMGALPSSEDFWLTDRGLMIFETTNGNYNKELFKKIQVESVLTWIRNLHAAWMSDSSKEWAEEFLVHQSGTYNNQYVIVDSKKLVPGQKPKSDLIWVTETMPGIAMKRDMTSLFVEQGFWPSFNTPYFPEIFEIAGYNAQMAKNDTLSDYYSYYNTSRYLIFRREAAKIQNFDDFKKVLRFNKYTTDEYGHGDPGQQILARYDLRNDSCIYGKPNAFGGLDTKATTALNMLSTLKFDAVGSPQYEDWPAWEFGKGRWENLSYDGLPRVWKFPWQNFSALQYNRCDATTKNDCLSIASCGWCGASQKCMLGYSNGPALEKCESGWTVSSMPSWLFILSIGLGSIALVAVIVVSIVAYIKKTRNPHVLEYETIKSV